MSEEKTEKFHNSEPETSENTELTVLKYAQPKILLLDMEENTEVLLKQAGYHITVGSFGSPYKVEKSEEFKPVLPNHKLPWDLVEQEIVVIDLGSNIYLDYESPKETSYPVGNQFYTSCERGVIDPRPLSMEFHRDDFDKILSSGGVFIIFSQVRCLQPLYWGNLRYAPFFPESKKTIDFDNWSFLSLLKPNDRGRYGVVNSLDTKLVAGQEISVVLESSEKQIGASLLAEHIDKAFYLCTLCPTSLIREFWVTLAKDKYGLPVSGAIVPNDQRRGWVFIFPHLKDKPRFLMRFFNEVLPSLSPRLFPYAEGNRWVQRSEYELPKVLEYTSQIQSIHEEAQKQVAKLEEAIEKERMEMAYLHDLIRETGTPLVNAVKKTLEVLGFQSVKDVDEEMAKTGQTHSKCEDLQIHDGSPFLLVEIKGISGLPTDEDSFQVFKHILIRMKEWDRTDVQGLTIFNHQKNLPPLDRENKKTFRQIILDNAEEQGFGLLTTWELFRLTRNYLKHGWAHEQVREVFYRHGHIEPIPAHYEFIGVIEHFWEKAGAVGVRIQQSFLQRGDCIAFEGSVEFEEQEVVSLEENRKSVEQVEMGGLAGIKTHFTKNQMKKNVRVFRLVKSESRNFIT